MPSPRPLVRRLLRHAGGLLIVAALLGASPAAVVAQTATPTVNPTPTATATPMLVRVEVLPKDRQVVLGEVQHYTATGHFSDASTRNLTQDVTYASSMPGVATAPNQEGDRSRIESVGLGTTTISATHVATGVSSSGADNSELTVTGPLECITLSPADIEREVSSFLFYTATGHFQGGGMQNLTQQVTYASSNPAVAVAPNTAGQKSRVDAVGPGVAMISATDPDTGISSSDPGCDGDATLTVPSPPTPTVTATATPTSTAPTATPTVTPTPTPTATPMLVRLEVLPKDRQIILGAEQRYTTTGHFSDGSERNMTQEVTYASSMPGVAAAPNDVGDRSRIDSVGFGMTTISATHVATGVSSSGADNTILTVTGPLECITLTPVAPEREVNESQFFTATGHFEGSAATENITQQVVYSSTNPAVAVAPNQAGQKSRVDAVGPGVTTIIATDPDTGVSSDDPGCDGNATLTVPPPPTPTVTVTTTPTSTAPTATPTVTPTPTPTATPMLVRLEVLPKDRQIILGTAQRYTTTGHFSDASQRNMTQEVTYASSMPGVATAPNDVGDRSRIDSVGFGMTTISATHVATGVSSSGADSTILTVTGPLECITLTPVAPEREVNESQFFTATGHFEGSAATENITQQVVYSSTNPAVAVAPNEEGQKSRVDVVGPGVTTIIATDPDTGVSSDDPGCDGNATITVDPPPTSTPGPEATPSSTPTGPTPTGPTGTPTLSATPTVTPSPMLVRLDVKPKDRQIILGTAQRYTTTGHFSDASQRNMTQEVTYASSNTAVAIAPNELDDMSRIDSVGFGMTTISATHVATGVSSSGADNTILTVTGPLECITVTPAESERNVGDQPFFTATGHFEGSAETENITQQVTYSSTNTAVAVAPNTPGFKSRVDVVGPGVAMIIATDPDTGVSSDDPGCDGNATITVDPPPTSTPGPAATPSSTPTGPTPTGPTGTPTLSATPTVTPSPMLVRLDVKPKDRQIILGTAQRYTTTGHFSDASQRNMTQEVTYASSMPGVATAPNDVGDRSRIDSVGFGMTTISATHVATGVSSSGADSTILTVTGPLECIVVTPTESERNVGDQPFFTATGHFEGSAETENITQQVTYSSTNTAVAVAPNTPGFKSRVDVVGPGVAMIIATDPDTGVSSDDPGCDGNATITVDPPGSPTPTPSVTPTATGPTPSPTLSATPTATATPKLVRLELSPDAATISIDQPRSLTARGYFEDGSDRNVTQEVVYQSSDPSIVEATNLEGNRSRVIGRSPGDAVISATDPSTGVESSGDDNSVITVREGPAFTPTPARTVTPTPTPVLDFLGDPDEAKAADKCAKRVTKGGTRFVGKKLQALARCADAIFNCLQTKPDDPRCLERAAKRCAKQLDRIGDAEDKLTRDVVGRCGSVAPTSLADAIGLGYDNVAATCLADFGTDPDDVAGMVACVAAQHSCRVDEAFEAQAPRFGELLGLIGLPLGLDSCFADFGGPGTHVGDPKGVGKLLAKCHKVIAKAGTRWIAKQLGSVLKCVDAVFGCIQTKPLDPRCRQRAVAKCDREYRRIAKEADKLVPAIDKKCGGLDFATLQESAGGNVEALESVCDAVGITALTSLGSYEQCLLRQHTCAVEALLRFASPRVEELLAVAGRTAASAFCPVAP